MTVKKTGVAIPAHEENLKNPQSFEFIPTLGKVAAKGE